MASPRDLKRFIDAQEGVFFGALSEIHAGRKHSHWMWYVFPQIAGLGLSPTSKRYAIQSRAEAIDFLRHPVLGPRLVECAEAVLGVPDRSAGEIFGPVDEMKLRSCATLFAHVSPPGSVFHRLLDACFEGRPDPRTLERLELEPDSDGKPGPDAHE